MATDTALSQVSAPRLRRIHHVELWVGNAKQAAFYYRHAFGFRQIAYSGMEGFRS